MFDVVNMTKQLWEGFLIAMQWSVIDLPGDFHLALWMLLIMVAFIFSAIYIIRKKKDF